MTHEENVARWIGAGKVGTAIGPGNPPIPGFSPAPIYVGPESGFDGNPERAGYRGDASALPFHDNSLDYVANANGLPRIANPVAAFAEWYRVLRPGGIIYLVVPEREATADHTRPLTTVTHLLDDYVRGTTSCDASHIDEFVYEMDWSRYEPDTRADDVPGARASLARRLHEAVARGEAIDIPFHTFESTSLRQLIETLTCWPRRRFNWEIVDEAAGFPGTNSKSIVLAIRVQKGWLDRARAEAFDVTVGTDRFAAVVRADAQRLARSDHRTDRGGT